MAISGLDEGTAPLQTWWQIFEDPVLESLIQRAREGNLDLRIAADRIRESRALYGIARGERIPDIDGSGVAQYDHLSESIAPLTGARDREDSFFGLGVGALWEMDFWGRIRRSIESADASYAASLEDYRDVLVLLNAGIAQSYIGVRTRQERIVLAEKNVVLQRGTLELTQNRYDAGLVPQLDVRQAELNLARTESTIPPLRIAVVLATNRLAVLLGGYPAELEDELSARAPIPRTDINPAVGIPADLIRQRPDIRAAERRLAAQTERIGIATADLYPTFTLFENIGLEAFDLSDLFEGESSVWSLGPQIRWNLFDGGRVRGRIEVEQARADQLVTVYRKTVLLAAEEVENGLVSYREELIREAALARSVLAAQQSAELVEALYRSGLTDFQNVLDAQRSLAAEDGRLAESQGLLASSLVVVYTALGGGWDESNEASAVGSEAEISLE